MKHVRQIKDFKVFTLVLQGMSLLFVIQSITFLYGADLDLAGVLMVELIVLPVVIFAGQTLSIGKIPA
tara:strand:- start:325 stop:528 length:204 start_codon:yes stop_codon:yes gene_type:complete